MSVGQGPTTALKEQTFASAFNRSLKISMTEKVRRYPFYHVDLNCGPGWNVEVDCPGSPRVFVEETRAVGRSDYYAFFIDNDPNNIDKLFQERDLINTRCFVFQDDNSELLPVVAEFITGNCGEKPQFAHGSVLADPNGYVGDELPLDELVEFAQQFPRMDLIVNFNEFTQKCGEGNKRRKRKGWASKQWPHPSELPKLLHRPYGLVQRRKSSRGHGFVTLELRSMKTGEHRNIGLYDIHSQEGRRILGALDAQKPLPF